MPMPLSFIIFICSTDSALGKIGQVWRSVCTSPWVRFFSCYFVCVCVCACVCERESKCVCVWMCVCERETVFSVWLMCHFQSIKERMDFLINGFETVGLTIWKKEKTKSYLTHLTTNSSNRKIWKSNLRWDILEEQQQK